MAKEFDIYLRNRLVECDLLVYSIPYRDGITVADRLILEAALNGYLLHMAVATQMRLEVASHIDKMIKLCLEKLNMKVGLGVSADFKTYSALYPNGSPIVISAPTISTLEQVFNEVESGLVLAVQPLVTQVSSSTGSGWFSLQADSDVAGTLKYGLLNLRNIAAMESTVRQFNQVDYIDTDSAMVVDAALQNLCYRLTYDAAAAVEIVALVLGTEIRHSLGRWYNSVALGSRVTGTMAQKFISAQSVVTLLQAAVPKLVKVLYPDETAISINILNLEIEMKRHRLLNEMDADALSAYDDMSFGDVDFVIL